MGSYERHEISQKDIKFESSIHSNSIQNLPIVNGKADQSSAALVGDGTDEFHAIINTARDIEIMMKDEDEGFGYSALIARGRLIPEMS